MKTLAALTAFAALSTSALAQTAVAQENITVGQGLPVRVVRVQQYQDRMPTATDDGRPVPPRTVTLVEFEVESCKTFHEGDFKVRVQQGSANQIAQVRTAVVTDCNGDTGAVQKFTVGTTEILHGKAMVIANPVLIETVPDAY